MNNSRKTSATLGLTALILTVASAGCGGGGGGGGGNDSTTLKPASKEMMASFNSIAEYCGEPTRLPIAKDGIGNIRSSRPADYEERGSFTWEWVSHIISVDGYQGGTLGIGGEPFDPREELKVNVTDRRGFKTGIYLEDGVTLADSGMGVRMSSIMPSGAIACVKSLSWLKKSPTQVGALPISTLVWSSREYASFPINTLGAFPVDGFELLGNFSPKSGVAFFSLNKRDVADPSAIQICSMPKGVSTWNCSLPKVKDDINRWTFYEGNAQPGVYMLTSSHPEPKK